MAEKRFELLSCGPFATAQGTANINVAGAEVKVDIDVKNLPDGALVRGFLHKRGVGSLALRVGIERVESKRACISGRIRRKSAENIYGFDPASCDAVSVAVFDGSSGEFYCMALAGFELLFWDVEECVKKLYGQPKKTMRREVFNTSTERGAAAAENGQKKSADIFAAEHKATVLVNIDGIHNNRLNHGSSETSSFEEAPEADTAPRIVSAVPLSDHDLANAADGNEADAENIVMEFGTSAQNDSVVIPQTVFYGSESIQAEDDRAAFSNITDQAEDDGAAFTDITGSQKNASFTNDAEADNAEELIVAADDVHEAALRETAEEIKEISEHDRGTDTNENAFGYEPEREKEPQIVLEAEKNETQSDSETAPEVFPLPSYSPQSDVSSDLKRMIEDILSSPERKAEEQTVWTHYTSADIFNGAGAVLPFRFVSYLNGSDDFYIGKKPSSAVRVLAIPSDFAADAMPFPGCLTLVSYRYVEERGAWCIGIDAKGEPCSCE